MDKAVSPLAATILLIALSVGMGAVVMSWGEEYIEAKAEFVQGVREVTQGCDSVSFKIISVGGKPQLCTTGEQLDLWLDNGPDIDVYDFHARLVGSEDLYVRETSLKAPLMKGDSTRVIIPHPLLGQLRQLKLTPKIQLGDQTIFCADKSITFENIPAC